MAQAGGRIHTVSNLITAYWAACYFGMDADSMRFETQLRKGAQRMEMTHRYVGSDLPSRHGQSCRVVGKKSGRFTQVEFADGSTEACLRSQLRLLKAEDSKGCEVCGDSGPHLSLAEVNGKQVCADCRAEMLIANEENHANKTFDAA